MYSTSIDILNPYEAIHGRTHTPGPADDNPNIMELCFHNGEQHMKEKIIAQLQSVAGSMPCITLAQAIQIVEDL